MTNNITNIDLMNLVCRVFAVSEDEVKNAIEAAKLDASFDDVIEKAEDRRRYLLKQRSKKVETSAQMQRRIKAKTVAEQLSTWISPSEIASQFDLKSTNDASGLMRIALKHGFVEEKRNEKGKCPLYRAIAA